MTVGQALERAEELRPGSRIALATRQAWLKEADALYPHYLCAMTDAALGETDRYVGEQAQYNSLLADLAAWLRRSYPTLTGAQWRW